MPGTAPIAPENQPKVSIKGFNQSLMDSSACRNTMTLSPWVPSSWHSAKLCKGSVPQEQASPEGRGQEGRKGGGGSGWLW